LKVLAHILPPDRVIASRVEPETPISGLCQTTSTLASGNLFFAIRGSQIDGHTFLEEVKNKRAFAAVETRAAFEAFPNTILVDSTRRALAEAASWWYGEPTGSIDLVGVTGTNGKTTTAFLLEGAWRAEGFKTGLIGTVEYRIGKDVLPAPLTTPDALTLQGLFARMRLQGVDCAAMEVSSIALDQSRVAGSRFRVGVFTNFTPDHLDYHGSMEQYLAAKKRLFTDFAPACAVLNTEDAQIRALQASVRSPEMLTFSTESSGADFAVRSHELTAAGIRAEIETPIGKFFLRSPLMGRHNLSNCLGVLATEYALGHDLEKTLQVLATSLGAPGRLERVALGENTPYVFVDYAHTEDALKNVLASLQNVRGEGKARILTVFGCGGDRDKGKRPKMGAVVSQMSDYTIATSDNPRTEDPESILDDIEKGIPLGKTYHRESDRRSAIRLALQLAEPGDYVLVAGKGHETYQILGTEKVPFDDRQVIRDYYGV
jgi:UDP-N-acetylmuramoyl-L-alanyl-D-glutamate--2,6-diaminopimelate ligase